MNNDCVVGVDCVDLLCVSVCIVYGVVYVRVCRWCDWCVWQWWWYVVFCVTVWCVMVLWCRVCQWWCVRWCADDVCRWWCVCVMVCCVDGNDDDLVVIPCCSTSHIQLCSLCLLGFRWNFWTLLRWCVCLVCVLTLVWCHAYVLDFLETPCPVHNDLFTVVNLFDFILFLFTFYLQAEKLHPTGVCMDLLKSLCVCVWSG